MIKALSLLVLFMISPLHQQNLINSEWTFKVTSKAVNVLKLQANNKALRYDCELDYTFKDSYTVKDDTLFLLEPNDSQPEDRGKVVYYRSQYIIKVNKMYCISSGELVKGKWVDRKFKITNVPGWIRSK
jgi:hypothetical protein